MNRRELIQAIVFSGWAAHAASAAVRGDEAMYVGGTMTNVPDKTEGRLDLTDSQNGTFTSKKNSFSFSFSRVTSLEYGQKAGRRVGVALAVNPLFLFSKKRKHFLTIGFSDEKGAAQGAVFEIGKTKVRGALATLETKTGKAVEYESEEAKKHVGN